MPAVTDDVITHFLGLVLGPRLGGTEIYQSTPCDRGAQTKRRLFFGADAGDAASWLRSHSRWDPAFISVYSTRRTQCAAAVRFRATTRAGDLAFFPIPPSMAIQDRDALVAVWIYEFPISTSAGDLSGRIARRLGANAALRIPIPKEHAGQIYIPVSEAKYDPDELVGDLMEIPLPARM